MSLLAIEHVSVFQKRVRLLIIEKYRPSQIINAAVDPVGLTAILSNHYLIPWIVVYFLKTDPTLHSDCPNCSLKLI